MLKIGDNVIVRSYDGQELSILERLCYIGTNEVWLIISK